MQRSSAVIPQARRILDALLDWVTRRPRAVLAGLVVVQWLAILAFALTVVHNGWLYYQGGDQLWYTTTGWLLGDDALPPTYVGYWWSMLFAPITLVTGADSSALSRYRALQRAGAGPDRPRLHLLHRSPHRGRAVRALGRRAVGRDAVRRHPPVPPGLSRQVRGAAPAAVVRTDGDGRLPVHGLPARRWRADRPIPRSNVSTEWLLAGLAAGVAVGIKPANAIFLVGAALAVLVARRGSAVLPFLAGLAPALLTLALWKERGLGSIPLFALDEVRLAAGTTVAAIDLHHYLSIDWDNLHRNMDGLREWFYSARLLQWLPFAGLLAVARRSLPVTALLTGWFGALLLFKGSTHLSTVESGSFFRYMMPAFPAYFLLAASIPLLIPTLATRLDQLDRPSKVGRLSARAVVAITVTAITLPLAAAALPRPIDSSQKALLVNGILIPVDPELKVTVTPHGEARTFTWTHPETKGTSVFYRVFRTGLGGPDTSCSTAKGAIRCDITPMIELTTTRRQRYTDGSPPPATRYRIGIAANWRDDAEGGDVFAVSPPVAATPRR